MFELSLLIFDINQLGQCGVTVVRAYLREVVRMAHIYGFHWGHSLSDRRRVLGLAFLEGGSVWFPLSFYIKIFYHPASFFSLLTCDLVDYFVVFPSVPPRNDGEF